jgi:AraC-like DNA-binding protein
MSQNNLLGKVPLGRIFKSGDMPLKTQFYHQACASIHGHDFYELVIVTNGTGLHITPEESFPITRGDAFLIKPGMVHGYENTRKLEIYNIFYIPEKLNLQKYDIADLPGYYAFFEAEPMLRQQHGFKSRLTLNDEALARALELVREIEREQNNKRPGAYYFAVSAFMALVGLLSRNYDDSDSKISRELLKLSEILSYIENNYGKSIRLERLASRSNMSVSTLSRLFRKNLGQSPSEYLIKLRLDKAAAMLKNSDSGIGEIAEKSGFCDSNYFSKMFSRTFGVSPREYRKQLTSRVR